MLKGSIRTMQVQMEYPAVAEVSTMNIHQNNWSKMGLSELLGIVIPEQTARRLKVEY